MEDEKWEFKFNSILINFLATSIHALKTTFSCLSSLNSNPLFSILITSYTLILIYFPGKFVKVVSSPVLNSTAILLIAILRLGVVQRVEREFNLTETEQLEETESNIVELEQTHKNYAPESSSDHGIEVGFGFDSDPGASFVEWHVGAPLEVIFEESEGEEEDDRNDVVTGDDPCFQRYPSLSLYYPESDSGDSSDGDFAGTGEWESWDEEDREGLIEIAIDGKRKGEAFRVEEENMIEIDISPARIKEFSDEKW